MLSPDQVRQLRNSRNRAFDLQPPADTNESTVEVDTDELNEVLEGFLFLYNLVETTSVLLPFIPPGSEL